MQSTHTTIIKKRRNVNVPRRQSGSILILTVILLGAMLLATLSYFEQSSNSIQMSGYSRDSAEALLLAESAMSKLYGEFIFGRDINGKNGADLDESFDKSDLANIPLHYLYYYSENNSIDENQPNILQLIANGEAKSGSAQTLATVSNHRVNKSGSNNLLINSLFVNTGNGTNKLQPILYTLDANHQLVKIDNKSWTGTAANDRAAAAWIELVRTSTENDTIQIYVQAAARVGKAKNYVQRFAGIFQNTLGILSAATESSP